LPPSSKVDCTAPQISLSLFSPPSPSDQRCLTNARQAILKKLQAWQTQVDSCPEASPGSGNSDGDMALVGIFASIGGIVLGAAIAGAIFVYLSRAIIQRWKQGAYAKVN